MALKMIRAASANAQWRVAMGWSVGMVVLLALLTSLFMWNWTRGSEARVLARLPADERARLFQLTRHKAEALCEEPGLEDRCRQEVELLSEFPECAADCRVFVAGHGLRGSR